MALQTFPAARGHDLTDEEWKVVKPLIPISGANGVTESLEAGAGGELKS